MEVQEDERQPPIPRKVVVPKAKMPPIPAAKLPPIKAPAAKERPEQRGRGRGRGRGGRGRGARPAREGREYNQDPNPEPNQGPEREEVAARAPVEPDLPVGLEKHPYVDAALAHRPAVNPRDKEVIQGLAKFRIVPWTNGKIQDTNTHPVLAGLREVATARCFGHVVTLGYRTIVSCYSAVRDDVLNNRFNGQRRLLDSTLDPPKEDRIDMILYRPVVVAADHFRSNASVPTVHVLPNGNHMAFFTCDWYDNFRPETIIDILVGHPDSMFAWVGHKFDGIAGVCGEGGWIRTSANKILFRPDMSTPYYGPHEPCDWLWSNTRYVHGGLTLIWSVKESLGSLRTVFFRLANPDVPLPSVLVPPENVVYEMQAFGEARWLPFWLDSGIRDLVGPAFPWLAAWIPLWQKKGVIVHRPLFDDLCNFLAARGRTVLTLKQLSSKARELLQTNAEFAQLKKLFPVEFGQLVEHTALAAFFHQISDKSLVMAQMVELNSDSLTRYNQSMSAIEKPREKPSPWVYAGAALGVAIVGYVVARRPAVLGHIARGFARGVTHLNVKPMAVAPVRHRVLDFASTLFGAGLEAGGILLGWAVQATLYPIGFCHGFYRQLMGRSLDVVHSDELIYVSPIIEEILKHAPLIGPFYSFAIPAVEIVHYWESDQPLLVNLIRSVVRVWFHRWTHSLGIVPAYAAHLFLNITALAAPILNMFVLIGMWWYSRKSRKIQAASVFPQLRQNVYLEPWEAREPIDSNLRLVERFDPNLSRIPRMQTVRSQSFATCSYLTKIGTFPKPGFRPETWFWWLVPTSAFGYVPAASDENLEAVLDLRVVIPAPSDPIDQWKAWLLMGQLFTRLKVFPYCREFATITTDDALLAAWYSHFEDSMRRRRYAEAMSLLRLHGYSILERASRHTETMVKTDEMLLKMSESDGLIAFDFKPRAIAMVDPLIQTAVGPEVYEVARRLKKELSWDSNVVDMIHADHPALQHYGPKKFRGVIRFRYFYASGATDFDLSRWMMEVLAREVAPGDVNIDIAVAGDDQLIVIKTASWLLIIEGDFSKFDQSQSMGPLQLQWRQFIHMGMSDTASRWLWLTYSASFVAYSHGGDAIKVEVGQRYQRRTGGPDTTAGNGLVTLNSSRFVMLDQIMRFGLDFDAKRIEQGFLDLGLEIKLRMTSQVEAVSFLKGVWLPLEKPFVDEEWTFSHYWAPLPSRVLKMGKSLRDPRILYATKDFEAAARLFLNDVCASSAGFVWSPVLRQFLRNFYVRAPVRDYTEMHKIQAAARPKPQIGPLAVQAMAERYGVDTTDILAIEAEMPKDPFVFHAHPLYVKMGLRDYN